MIDKILKENSVTISDDKNFELEYLIFSKVLWEIPDSIIG